MEIIEITSDELDRLQAIEKKYNDRLEQEEQIFIDPRVVSGFLSFIFLLESNHARSPGIL